jgi:hypothetical protein
MGGDGPPRGGTRGGRDQFNWEDVKSDKDREFYLGASVKASVGRWQKGKDILWYTRGKGGAEDSVAAELAAVKAEEERVRAAVALRCVVVLRMLSHFVSSDLNGRFRACVVLRDAAASAPAHNS